MEKKIVTLKSYENMVDAKLDCRILKNKGIECYIGNEQVMQLYPMFKDIDDGLSIYLFEQDLEPALKLLKEYHSADLKESFSE